MRIAKTQRARFDARLTKSQKEFFELAARLSGFKSQSEFMIHASQQGARAIVERDNAILATEGDKNVFFDARVSPTKPNMSLKDAAKLYQKQVAAN
jgi:uncharacterized protein (DUF1778 family)